MEAAQPWMTQDKPDQVRSMFSEADKAQEIRKRKEHFKIISDLIQYGTADISNDPKWIAYANRYTMAMEDYMKCFPEDVAKAIEAAENYRGEKQNDGINRKSHAFYQLMGCAPECVSKLFAELYPDADGRRSAWRRFFNAYPIFKVTDKKL